MSAPAMSDLIADSVERLFAGRVTRAHRDAAATGAFDPALWAQVVEAGLPRMLCPESAGGLGLKLSDAWPVLHGVGHAQLPLPLPETVLAAKLLAEAGLDDPGLHDSPLTLLEQGRCPGLRWRADGNTVRLSGEARRVPWARHARAAAVALDDGRVARLDLASRPGLSLEPHADLAGLPADTLRLDDCAAVVGSAPAWREPVWTLGAAARAAAMAGALEWALAQSVRYAGERVQFGRPIGANQAIQQQLALMAGDAAAARMAAQVALADLDADATAGWFSTAVAKLRCGEAATRGTGIAHQVHGAIGFTQEHALHHATRRLWAWRADFGTDAEWAAELGRAAIAAGSAGFWSGLTAKTLAPPPRTP